MTLESNLWDTDDPDWRLPGVTDREFAEFERRHNLRLPELFKAMYRIQNGGNLRDVEEIETLAPLGAPARSPEDNDAFEVEPICTVQRLADRCLIFGELDPGRIFMISENYGHTVYALSYSDAESTSEPKVVYLDNESCGGEQVADSFEEWISRLTEREDQAAVDWNEHRDFPILYESSLDVRYTDAPAQHIENVLCREGERGLILFTKTESEGKVTELERVALPRGVDQAELGVRSLRPKPDATYELHLQPCEPDDLHYLSSRLKSDGRWKVERSQGVPVYCTLESTDRKALKALAAQLREQGFAQKAAPVEMPAELQGMLDEMARAGGAMMQESLGKAYSSDPEPKAAETPISKASRGGDPSKMNRKEIIAELSELQAEYARRIAQVNSADDAHRLIAGFEPQTQRYVALMRALDPATNFMTMTLELIPVERPSMEALGDLSRRSAEAQTILQEFGRDVAMRALRNSRRR